MRISESPGGTRPATYDARVPWTDFRILVVDTGRVWWRLLPQILGLYLAGWLRSQLTLGSR